MQSRTHIVAFLLALTVSGMLTPVIRRIAHTYGLLDTPDQRRKIHRQPIPRLGGIAIALGFFAPLVGLLIYNNDISALFTAEPRNVVGLFAGGTATLLLGVWDDIRGMRARNKLVFQILISMGMVVAGFEITRIALPFYGMVEFTPMVSFFITVLWFVTIMNAVNLIDGLDGLAGGVAFFAVMTMFIVASMDPVPNLLTTLFAATLAGSVVGFLFYNFNPATIFMGDSGSLFLGFTVASVAVQTQAKSSTAIALSVCVLALGLPLLDTALSVVRRLRRGRRVFEADREHIHHRLLALGLSPRQAILVLYGLCVLLAVFALVMKVEGGSGSKQGWILAALAVVLIGLGQIFRFRERLHQRRLTYVKEDSLPPDARLQIREMGIRIRNSVDTPSTWNLLRDASEILDVRDMKLRLYLRPRSGERIQQEYDFHRDHEVFSQLPHSTLSIPLVGREHWYGDLVFVFRESHHAENRERELLIHMLAEALVEHIENHVLGQHRDEFVVRKMPERNKESA